MCRRIRKAKVEPALEELRFLSSDIEGPIVNQCLVQKDGHEVFRYASLRSRMGGKLHATQSKALNES
jgi:hypothetical protein